MNRFAEYILPRHHDLFHSKYLIDPDTGCWIWQSQGIEPYGKIQLTHKPSRKVAAHRFSAWISGMPVTDDILVCHHCDTPRCVNPEHLFLGTAADNARDKTAKGRNYTAYGESNPFSKLSESDVRWIRQNARKRDNIQQIAERYGVADTTILKIINRTTWRHIE